MRKINTSLNRRRIRHPIWLVLTLFILSSYSLQNAAGSTYFSLLIQNYMTISSPPVILQNGTSGTSTIYTNSTSAKVSVSAPKANNTEDYVDLLSNVDSSDDIGTHSNFTAQKYGPDQIYDILKEGNAGSSSGFNETTDSEPTFTYGSVLAGNYNDTQSDNGQTEDIREADGLPGGNIGIEGYYTLDTDISEGSINSLKIGVNAWYTAQNGPGDDGLTIRVWNYSGSSWDLTTIIVEATSDGTTYIDSTAMGNEHIRDSDGEIRIGFIDERRGGGEDVQDTYYIDYLYVEIDYISTNYEMDLEVQWTNADYDETFEELSIYADIQNNSYSLDATGGYVIVGNGTVDWGSPEGTISFWVKMDGSVQGRFWGQNGNMETRWSGTNLLLDWGGTGTMTSDYSFSADTWYFVAIVWDENNDNLYLYVGNETSPPTLDANSLSGSWTGTTPTPTENRFLNGLGGNQPVDGHGDDLRYWNIARNLTEIQNDYNTELTGLEPNLRSYFKLNNNFDDIGPDNNNGSGYDGYSFSTDVPFFQLTENIQVDVWNGSTWQNIFNNLTNGWNNASVSAYLTFSNFSIRFRGSNETNDTSQDSWNIDATLLYTYTFTEKTYDYVLRVNNTVTDSWEIRLKKYSNVSIARLQNCTVYFHNSTDGTSPQIVIENGAFVNETGAWYDLGSLETIYIAMTVEADRTGTSYVYVYLEVLSSGTTTYAQYIITFEIN